MNIIDKIRNVHLYGIKFKKLTQDWLLYKKHMVKESTYLNYNYMINLYLNKRFGNKRLNYFLEYNINEFVDKLENDNLSNKTIRDIILLLKSILKYAERKYNVNFKLELISIPISKKRETKIFSEKEIKKIEDACEKSNDVRCIGILIAIYTGMRIGEICALKWSNIDFNKKLINVEETLQRVYLEKSKTKIIITPPKTKTSERKIPIPTALYDKLKERSELYSKKTYVITGEEKYIEPRTFQHTYKKVLETSKVKYRNFHCLRHTFATRCIKVGMDIKSLSEVLGHSNVNITLNRYVHSSYETKKRFLERL